MPFTDSEIAQIIEEFFNTVGSRQYIGARYVPIFGRKDETSINWDNSAPYEPLTIVLHLGNSYTSRQYVPAGVNISDTTFWAQTGNYNAQIEQYRTEVAAFAEQISTAVSKADQASEDVEELTTTVTNNNTAINNRVDGLESNMMGIINGLDDRIDNVESDISGIEEDIEELKVRKIYFGIIGDSFCDYTTTSPQRYAWVSTFANETGLIPISMAGGGSGFTKSGQTPNKLFVNQLTEISNDPRWEQVEVLVVYGGLNDYLGTTSSVANMNTAFDNFKRTWDALTYKPRIIFAFFNCGYVRQTAYNWASGWYRDCMIHLRDIGMPGLVEGVPYWLWGVDEGVAFGSDDLHPTAVGARIHASYFLRIYNGTYDGVHFRIEIPTSANGQTITDSNKSGVFFVNFDNGIITAGYWGVKLIVVGHNTGYALQGIGGYQTGFGLVGNSTQVEEQWQTCYTRYTGTSVELQQMTFETRSGLFKIRWVGDVVTSNGTNLSAHNCFVTASST